MTDKITPATDDEIANIRQYLDNCSGGWVAQDAMVIPNITVAALIARIEADKAEIVRLRAALDELLDWVNGERRTSDDRLAEIELLLPPKENQHE